MKIYWNPFIISVTLLYYSGDNKYINIITTFINKHILQYSFEEIVRINLLKNAHVSFNDFVWSNTEANRFHDNYVWYILRIGFNIHLPWTANVSYHQQLTSKITYFEHISSLSSPTHRHVIWCPARRCPLSITRRSMSMDLLIDWCVLRHTDINQVIWRRDL